MQLRCLLGDAVRVGFLRNAGSVGLAALLFQALDVFVGAGGEPVHAVVQLDGGLQRLFCERCEGFRSLADSRASDFLEVHGDGGVALQLVAAHAAVLRHFSQRSGCGRLGARCRFHGAGHVAKLPGRDAGSVAG